MPCSVQAKTDASPCTISVHYKFFDSDDNPRFLPSIAEMEALLRKEQKVTMPSSVWSSLATMPLPIANKCIQRPLARA